MTTTKHHPTIAETDLAAARKIVAFLRAQLSLVPKLKDIYIDETTQTVVVESNVSDTIRIPVRIFLRSYRVVH